MVNTLFLSFRSSCIGKRCVNDSRVAGSFRGGRSDTRDDASSSDISDMMSRTSLEDQESQPRQQQDQSRQPQQQQRQQQHPRGGRGRGRGHGFRNQKVTFFRINLEPLRFFSFITLQGESS